MIIGIDLGTPVHYSTICEIELMVKEKELKNA